MLALIGLLAVQNVQTVLLISCAALGWPGYTSEHAHLLNGLAVQAA